MRIIIVLAATLVHFNLMAQDAPHFEVDTGWPGALPGKWISGQLGGVCVDAHDHIVVVDRRNITEEEHETSVQAPPFVMFDIDGDVVASWGDPDKVPESLHGCSFDSANNIWVAGNDDGIIQKYSHEGDMLLQIGVRGHFDSAEDTLEGSPLNSSHEQLFLPSAVVADPDNGDIYVADGYGNRRIAVFDKNGNFLRQWGRQATQEEIENGEGGAFAKVIHCIAMSNEGLLYVCDRQGDRVQVFDKMGNFVRNIWIRTGTDTLPDTRGTAWWVEFSRDPGQRHMYVMNGRNEQVHVLDHESGEILSTFGRPGHQAGNFTHGHTLAVDSRGNIYVAETNWGRRVQRFNPVK
jgi:DNA-binding beta-propeller fold protein YncE